MNHIFYMRNGWTKITISIPLRTAGLGRSLVFQRWIPWKPDATLALLYEMPAGGKRRIWWVNWLIWWKILKSHPLLKVVSLIFLQRKVKVFRFSCSFFLRETCMKCSNIFFFNKQAGGSSSNPIGWWWKNLGGFTFRHFPQAASWNPLSLLTKKHQRNEGLVKRKRS